MFLEICLHCLWFPWQFPDHIISAKSISTIDEIVSLHLALHFYSIILLVKYSSKLIIHGHFLLLQGVAEQHCFTRRNGRGGLASQTSLRCLHWETTAPLLCFPDSVSGHWAKLPWKQSMHYIMFCSVLKILSLSTGELTTLLSICRTYQYLAASLGPLKSYSTWLKIN